mgnify:CR=1 FL=1
MHHISVSELKEKLKDPACLQLVDVREPWEHALFNIGGTLIPLGSLTENIEKISTSKTVVFYCQKGIRSQIAIQRLEQKLQLNNLINLQGGMDAWEKAERSSLG